MIKPISPCPFCGSSSLYITSQAMAFYVVCEGCDCNGPKRALFPDAIDDWNGLPRERRAREYRERKIEFSQH